MFKKQWDYVKTAFSAPDKNKEILYLCTYSILAIVAFVMTILNVFTDKGLLTYCTLSFSVLCGLNVLLSTKKRLRKLAVFLFAVEIVVMFTFFLVTGNPEGFSAIWICMLPSLGLLFFGLERGALLCAVMLSIIVALLWTNLGDLLQIYNYTESFKMRFPILYIAFFGVAFFLETIRVKNMKTMLQLQMKYKELSERDTLTHVYNRQGFYAALESRPEFHTEGVNLGVVLFDIDDFKDVNDKYGHNAGDMVLREIADTISQMLDSVVCRWGGEEFVACYYGKRVTDADLEALRCHIEKKIFKYENDEIPITISGGVYQSTELRISQIDRMIDYADHALYKAKDNGKNRIMHFEPSYMVLPAQSKESSVQVVREKKLNAQHIKIVEDFREALKNNELVVYLQLIYNIKKKMYTGAEVLCRWQHPKDGLIMPAKFIEVIREEGMLDQLDFYMFEKTCQLLEKLQEQNLEDFRLSCNFARGTFSAPNFMRRFNDIRSKYNFNPTNLTLEITEDLLLNNKTSAYQNVLRCRKEGFSIALDDLGSGYTSFNDLCDYPIDIIKVDRHIVSKTAMPQGKALLYGLVQLAQHMDVLVLCEGVETKEENDLISYSGCDFIQGFYYSEALPIEMALAKIEKKIPE